MISAKKDLGIAGEKAARKFLADKGLKIIEVNWKNRIGEIDIIAKEGKCIVFVEVKTRSGLMYGRPEESINTVKRNKLVRTALCYIKKNSLENSEFRFDAVSILNGRIDYCKGAFTEVF